MVWIFILGGVAAAAAGLFYRWWVARISLGWPVAQAKIDSSRISKASRPGMSSRRTSYTLKLHYSYFVSGSLYGATWFKNFGVEGEADRLLRSLNELPVLIRYDPKRPERSYFDPYRDIRIDDIKPIPNSHTM